MLFQRFGIARISELSSILYDFFLKNTNRQTSNVSLAPICSNKNLSVWDPPRSTCNAPERTGLWMVKYYERKRREEDEDYVQSQPQVGSQSQVGSQYQSQGFQLAEARPAFDEKHQEYTERDDVLQTLVARKEKKKKAVSDSGKDISSGQMTWVR